MADVIHVPSIWDYIAQAGQQGIQSYQDAKRYNEEQARQEAGLAAQLFQSGAIGSQDLARNPLIAKITPNIQPNKPELMRNIAASPDINPATGKPWNDFERSAAGAPTQAEQADQATKLQTDQIRQKYMNGGHLTDAEATAIGVPTLDDQMVKTNKNLAAVAPAFIDTALAPLMQNNGGRIPYRGWEAAVNAADQAYQAARAKNGLPPEPAARNFFTSQILDRLAEQKKQDIQMEQARGMAAARPTPQDRMFDNLTSVINSRITEKDALARGDPLLMMKMSNAKYQNDPNVVRYKLLDRNIRRAQNAQAKIAGGLGADLMVGLDQDSPDNLTPTGAAGANIGNLPPLTPADIQKAKEDAGFKNWLVSRGYKF